MVAVDTTTGWFDATACAMDGTRYANDLPVPVPASVTEADLDSLFRYCADCSISAVKDGKKLSNFVLRAAGDALAYRETAGVVLNAISADRLADAALMVLEEEINAINYKVRFRAAARLALFILRHRMRRRDFLHPSSRDPANRRRAQRLEALITRSLASRHAGDDLTVALQELQLPAQQLELGLTRAGASELGERRRRLFDPPLVHEPLYLDQSLVAMAGRMTHRRGQPKQGGQGGQGR